MKKIINALFLNGWVTFALLLIVAIADLITKESSFGMGFVLTFLYFIGLGIYWTNKW